MKNNYLPVLNLKGRVEKELCGIKWLKKGVEIISIGLAQSYRCS